MTSQKNKIKEATSFFGVERMEKLEGAIKEQSQRTLALQKTKKVVGQLKMAGSISLIIYSISLTAFIFGNKSPSAQMPVDTIASQPENITPIVVTNDSIVNFSELELETKITVKKGDSLSGIAQKMIKENGLKNTYENRQLVINELKNKNSNIAENKPIKYGWTLLSLSQKEILQICKN